MRPKLILMASSTRGMLLGVYHVAPIRYPRNSILPLSPDRVPLRPRSRRAARRAVAADEARSTDPPEAARRIGLSCLRYATLLPPLGAGQERVSHAPEPSRCLSVIQRVVPRVLRITHGVKIGFRSGLQARYKGSRRTCATRNGVSRAGRSRQLVHEIGGRRTGEGR